MVSPFLIANIQIQFKFDRKRISANPSSNPNSNSKPNSNPNPKAQ